MRRPREVQLCGDECGGLTTSAAELQPLIRANVVVTLTSSNFDPLSDPEFGARRAKPHPAPAASTRSANARALRSASNTASRSTGGAIRAASKHFSTHSAI